MFVSPKWETNHHFHCCCVCAIDAKMHYCKNFHWLVFCFIFLWLHILIGWHILFALFAVFGDTKPAMSTITCMSRIHIHLSIWISSNCIFTSYALSSSNAQRRSAAHIKANISIQPKREIRSQWISEAILLCGNFAWLIQVESYEREGRGVEIARWMKSTTQRNGRKMIDKFDEKKMWCELYSYTRKNSNKSSTASHDGKKRSLTRLLINNRRANSRIWK